MTGATGPEESAGLTEAVDGHDRTVGGPLDVRYAGSAATGRGVTVAVIDSGWDYSYADPRIVHGIGLVHPSDDLALFYSHDDIDRVGHGTACANIILDIAPDCTVMPVRVFGRRLETSADIIVAALNHVAAKEVRVVNLSLGTVRDDALISLYRACECARRAGVIIVSAVRMTADHWSYPGVFEPVIGVGPAEVDSFYAVEYFPEAAVECGVRVHKRRIRGLRGREALATATSFAAPVVTALVARWLEDDPTLNLNLVRTRFLECLTYPRRHGK